jgi:hypothetical protein
MTLIMATPNNCGKGHCLPFGAKKEGAIHPTVNDALAIENYPVEAYSAAF